MQLGGRLGRLKYAEVLGGSEVQRSSPSHRMFSTVRNWTSVTVCVAFRPSLGKSALQRQLQLSENWLLGLGVCVKVAVAVLSVQVVDSLGSEVAACTWLDR